MQTPCRGLAVDTLWLQDADLVVLEFSANDKRDAPYSDPERKGYEQLIRKLLNMQGRWEQETQCGAAAAQQGTALRPGRRSRNCRL